MAQALVQARVDAELKENVDTVLRENGLDIPTAIRMFMAKIVQVDGIPFDVRHRAISDDLAEALADVQLRRNLHGPYASAQEAVAAMLED